MKKNGFTLIELLAVIVILAIIALIATPIVLNIINDVRKNAFEQTVNAIIDSARYSSVLSGGKEITYIYENNKWIENKLNINGKIPEYINLTINKSGQIMYQIRDGQYIATKTYESELLIKEKIGCFEFDEKRGAITDYYCGRDNEGDNVEILDVIIPEKIKNRKVKIIGDSAFFNKGLSSIIIPNDVITIESFAFRDNYLEEIIIPAEVTNIGSYAFYGNKLINITIPKKLISIGDYAFSYNKITSITIPSNVLKIGEDAFKGNSITSVTINGKSSFSDFESYPQESPFGWYDGYSDNNIIWN